LSSSVPKNELRERVDLVASTTMSTQTWLGRAIPYFRNPEHVLVLKLDIILLVWTFIAGLLKEMDQSAMKAAYVSGMQESLSLYGNELVEFTTYFSVGYALFIVPAQLIQTKI
jgi:MFS transporter, ACS family, pantothenate transporter